MVYRALVVLVLVIALAGCSSMQRSKPAAAQPAASTAAMPAQAAPPTASYSSSSYMQRPGASYMGPLPPLEANRKINEQDCTKAVDLTAGNLHCR